MNQKSLTELSKILKSQLLTQFPKWRKYIETAETNFNNEKFSSFYIEIPSPIDEKCFLSILDRGDCVEVSFYDGNPPGPAERQITSQEGSEVEAVAETIDFVKKVTEEKVVIGRERLFWLFGNKPAPPQFIQTNELEKKKKKLVSICSWNGKYNWEFEK